MSITSNAATGAPEALALDPLALDPLALDPFARREPVSVDTQPFVFAGNDGWGHQVRGSIVALDAADAFAQLLSMRIAADSVTDEVGTSRYAAELAGPTRTSPTVGELVKRLTLSRRAG